MDIHDWPYIKKSARRKKRLVKKDFDKRLIQLQKKQQALSAQMWALPSVKLEKPYQKGWVRLFVLRHDIARSDKAEFYQGILNKINQAQWHYDRSFKRRKIRKGTYHYYDADKQKLREPSYEEFHDSKLNHSDAEKACFSQREIWNDQYRKWYTVYYFTEPWRFVLAIKPHIIYEKKQHDELLAKQLSEIDKYIDWNHLLPRIWKLKGGSHRFWSGYHYERWASINELKNKPRYTSTEAYLDY